MATKAFKKLPKDSQRAAFAQMDKDGVRQTQKGGSLKKSSKKYISEVATTASGSGIRSFSSQEYRIKNAKAVMDFTAETSKNPNSKKYMEASRQLKFAETKMSKTALLKSKSFKIGK